MVLKILLRGSLITYLIYQIPLMIQSILQLKNEKNNLPVLFNLE